MLAISYEDIYCTVILHSVARQGCQTRARVSLAITYIPVRAIDL